MAHVTRIMNPDIANTMFCNHKFLEAFCVQSVHAKTIGKDNVKFPIFSEYGINHPVKFRVMQWHNYFDALVGTSDFLKLGATIDYGNNIITIGNQDIPLHFHSSYKQSDFQVSKDPRFMSIPVNIKQGEVYFPSGEYEGSTLIRELMLISNTLYQWNRYRM